MTLSTKNKTKQKRFVVLQLKRDLKGKSKKALKINRKD